MRLLRAAQKPRSQARLRAAQRRRSPTRRLRAARRTSWPRRRNALESGRLRRQTAAALGLNIMEAIPPGGSATPAGLAALVVQSSGKTHTSKGGSWAPTVFFGTSELLDGILE